MGLFDFLKKDKKEEVKKEEVQNEVLQNEELESEVVQNEEVQEEALNEEVVQEEVKDVVENVEEVAIEETVVEETVTEEVKDVEIVEEVIEVQEENIQEVQEDSVQEEVQQENVQENSDVNTEETNETIEEVKEDVKEEIKDKKTEEVEEKVGFFTKVKKGLEKTRSSIVENIEVALNSFTKIDEDLFEELEESLILADMGVETSVYIIDQLRKEVKRRGVTDVSAIKGMLINIISDILSKDIKPLEITPPTVVLVIGVNGAGKTTSIGKLANRYKSEGKSVLLVAGDTFRAAAIEQLEVWANRVDVPIIKNKEKADPAAVIFDGLKAGKSRNTDVVIVDTAGRLQNKKNLMDELKKITKIVEREYEGSQVETFLVLDGTTGQNAVSQAKLFAEIADITGLIITKLDGTAKGGVIVSISNEMNIPVRYVGLGEKMDDLEPFDSNEFAKALFD